MSVGVDRAIGRAVRKEVDLPLDELLALPAMEDSGRRMYELIGDLYPICRSITGDGFRATLARIREHIPLDVHEVPSGTLVFDWVVPREWTIRDAWIKDERGQKG